MFLTTMCIISIAINAFKFVCSLVLNIQHNYVSDSGYLTQMIKTHVCPNWAHHGPNSSSFGFHESSI
jgi:hypothetical protein